MYLVSYVPKGCDATVYWGATDFKFKNTNETPIMITAEASAAMCALPSRAPTSTTIR